jgi:hypothetical protein
MKSVTILAALLVPGVALGGVLPSPLSGSVLPSPLPGSEMEGGLGSPLVLHGCVHNVCTIPSVHVPLGPYLLRPNILSWEPWKAKELIAMTRS